MLPKEGVGTRNHKTVCLEVFPRTCKGRMLAVWGPEEQPSRSLHDLIWASGQRVASGDHFVPTSQGTMSQILEVL